MTWCEGALGLALGWVADQAFGDPARFHPVAGFGRVASALERRIYADDRVHGVAFTAVLVGSSAALGVGLDAATRRHPVARTVATATCTWAVLGGRSLIREGKAVAEQLDASDLDAAREQITHLVSRDPQSLDADGLARAALESIAENTSDAVVAPLFWGAVAGMPGLLGYRASNTLDAMVGYHNERYERFGWASAKLDDVLNWVPARIAAGLTIAAAPLVGGRSDESFDAIREGASAHPSPNGGVVEAAFAGALGVRLGGRNTYGGVVEDRGVLGHGPAPIQSDLGRANKLASLVSAGAAALAVGGAALRGHLGRRCAS